MMRGFSLVELSIVLVILGLLTGGILGGQSLIRAAELRSVTTEEQKIKSALYAFKDKYFVIPGDMNNATQFWTSAGGNGRNSACGGALMTSTVGTCNGDGDGQISTSGNGLYEYYLLWNHLGRAGLVEGSYPYHNNSTDAIAGTHFMASKVGGNVGWISCYTSRGNYGRGAQNMLLFTKPHWSAGACSFGNSAGLSAAEAWNIDKKVDDGLATTGTLTATNSYDGQTDCLTDNFTYEVITSQYELDATRKSCHLYFVLGL